MNEERTWTGNSEVDAAIVMLDRIDCSPEDDSRVDAVEATLRRLHARVQELEGMLDSVGAGGVSAQRVTQAADHIAQDRKMVAVPVEVPKVGSAWRHKNGNAYRVVAIANNCDAHFSERYHVTVVYQGENGKMWARRADDWHRSMTHDATAPSTAPVVLPEPGINTASHAGFRVIGYTEQQVRELLDKAACTKSQTTAQEPFGYFKAEPFGWRDCAETDEGAIALYEAPQSQADARAAERVDALYKALEVCSAELFAQCAHQGRAMKYVEQARKALAAEQCARADIAAAKEGSDV